MEQAQLQSVREKIAQQALETVAVGGPLVGVLELLCRTMEEESRDRVIACIHPLDEDAVMFRDTAAPSLDQSYARAVNGMLVSSMTGPCCYAVVTRQTVVVPEVAADPRFDGFRTFTDTLGVRSCWSTPIFSSNGKMLGTFAHYYFEARDPSPRDEQMVQLLTRAAAVAIERSWAEAALRDLNATLEQRVAAQARERDRIWKVSHDLMLVQSSDRKVLNVNPAWKATLGWTETNFLGRTLDWVLHPEDLERTRAEFDRISAGDEARVFENRYRHKDGSIRWLSWRAVHDQEGLIYAVARDVTELKHAEDALQDTRGELARVSQQMALSTMAATIVHEIAQPLSGILINANAGLRWLAKPEPELDEVRHLLEEIVDDGRRASEVIATVRAMFGKEHREKYAVDLNSMVREVLALSNRELVDHQVSVEGELCRDLPKVMADRAQIEQVLINLVSNAVEAMSSVTDRRRCLMVKSDIDAGNVLVAVGDTGIGIGASDMDRLFEPFFTTKSHGMGLGLSICRTVVEGHGGHLRAFRRDPHGTLFHILLPSCKLRGELASGSDI